MAEIKNAVTPCLSLACLPNMRVGHALQYAGELARKGQLREPLWPSISLEHVQLAPQMAGVLDLHQAQQLREAFTGRTQFRLHANVRITPAYRNVDLSTYTDDLAWFAQAAALSRALGAPAYSAHSGYRKNATLAQVLDNTRRCADLFGCPVAVEGQYPSEKDDLLVNSWQEYRTVYESGVPYALDLSHLHIVATVSGERPDGLIAEMLACERCIEIHVSTNDGHGDWHQVCDPQDCAPLWWLGALQSALTHNTGAVVFTEGNLIRRHAHQRVRVMQGVA